MSTRNQLIAAPPYAIEKELKALGKNLRLARVRRNLSLQDLADKIGTGRRVIADAERGKPSTAIAVYLGMLWALGMLPQIEDLAHPSRDEEGQILARAQERLSPGRKRGPHDF